MKQHFDWCEVKGTGQGPGATGEGEGGWGAEAGNTGSAPARSLSLQLGSSAPAGGGQGASAGVHLAHSMESTGPASGCAFPGTAGSHARCLRVTWARTQQTGQQTGPGMVCPTLDTTSHLLPLAQPGLDALFGQPSPWPQGTAGGRQGRPGVLQGEGKQRSVDPKAGAAGL